VDKPVVGSRVFRQSRAFAYLEDHDRFLAASEPPQFSYGFIGCGMMGLEHIRNTLLVGPDDFTPAALEPPR
jgi:hypothetical protein